MRHVSDYVYDALPRHGTIRILVLSPAIDFQAPIEAYFEYDDQELSQNNTTSSAGFNAVSYCWGEPSFTHKIFFKSGSLGSTASLAITANVDCMLRHLRKPYKERRLWIDAICINQADVEEKTVQVRLMGNIYRAALKVHVWLGAGGTFDAQAAFSYLKRLVVTDELKWDSLLKSTQHHESYEPIKIALQQLFLNPWFARRWILQEIALGHDITVHYGYHKIAWHWFSRGIILLPEADVRHSVQGQWASYRPYVAATMAIGISLRESSDLPHLLLAHASAKCYDHRDRLFALYGILGRNSKFPRSILAKDDPWDLPMPNAMHLEVDYTKSWVEIYKGLAEILVGGHHEEFWFHLQTFGSIRDPELGAPSWVPDWRQEDISILPRSFYPGSGSAIICHMPGGSGLRISGWYYGHVTKVWDISPQSQSKPNDIVPDVVAERPWLSGDLINQVHEHFRLHLARLLLLAARTVDQKHRTAHGLTRYWWAALNPRDLWSEMSRITDWLDASHDPFGTNWPDSVSSLMNSIFRHNRVFRTMRESHRGAASYGALGITSAEVRLGDAAFRCSRHDIVSQWASEEDLLLILRPTSQPEIGNAFRLVGFCFMAQDKVPGHPQFWEVFPEENAVLV